MLAGEQSHLLIKNLCGANAGDLVGRHAHAHASGADQEAQLGPAGDNALGHGLGVIRVIRRKGGMRAQIHEAYTLPGEVLLENFLQLITAMIGTQRKGDRRPRVLIGRGNHLAAINEAEQGGDALLNLVPAIQINLVRAADGVADILFKMSSVSSNSRNRKVFSAACG